MGILYSSENFRQGLYIEFRSAVDHLTHSRHRVSGVGDVDYRCKFHSICGACIFILFTDLPVEESSRFCWYYLTGLLFFIFFSLLLASFEKGAKMWGMVESISTCVIIYICVGVNQDLVNCKWVWRDTPKYRGGRQKITSLQYYTIQLVHLFISFSFTVKSTVGQYLSVDVWSFACEGIIRISTCRAVARCYRYVQGNQTAKGNARLPTQSLSAGCDVTMTRGSRFNRNVYTYKYVRPNRMSSVGRFFHLRRPPSVPNKWEYTVITCIDTHSIWIRDDDEYTCASHCNPLTASSENSAAKERL